MTAGSTAQTHLVTVPDRDAADRVADVLAGRGHALVAVREVNWAHKDPTSWWFGRPLLRPDEEGQWEVSSVATGPLPDDDERWWHAQEDEAVRRIARDHGGRSAGSGGGETATILRAFTRVGIVHELDEDTVQERRRAALSGVPAREAPEPWSPTGDDADDGPGEDDLPSGPGEPVRLDLPADVDWAALEHAYGDASDVPDVLAGLATNDDRWAGHLDALIGSVNHQGSTYSATAPTMEVLAALATAPTLAPRRRLDLLTFLFLAGSGGDVAAARGSRPDHHAEPTRSAVTAATPTLLKLWPTVTRPERRLLLLLAALAGSTTAPTDAELTDDASRLARAMVRDEKAAEALLVQLARSDEQLLELVSSDTPLRVRLVAALEVLLWVR